jgi:hypothetical protein
MLRHARKFLNGTNGSWKVGRKWKTTNVQDVLQHQKPRKCWENVWYFWPEGQTVNQKYYLEVLTKLRERVRKKRPELWKNTSWILHQDNLPAHNALAVKQFLADKCIPVFDPPPPQFTGFSPCDNYLFPKLLSSLKGIHFQSVSEVK